MVRILSGADGNIFTGRIGQNFVLGGQEHMALFKGVRKREWDCTECILGWGGVRILSGARGSGHNSFRPDQESVGLA